MNHNLYYVLLSLATIPTYTRVYNITFPSLGFPGYGSDDKFQGRLENGTSVQTEVFDFTGTCLTSEANAPCTFLPDLTDIGSDLKYLYMMTQGDNILGVDEVIVIDVITGTRYFVDESFSVTDLSFGDISTYPSGCEVLTVDLPGDSMSANPQTPTCTTFPPTLEPTVNPTSATNDPTTTPSKSPSKTPTASPSSSTDTAYTVQISISAQGGSTDDFYVIVKGTAGQTDKHLVNGMTDGGLTGNTYTFNFVDFDVGTITNAYLVTYGSDILIVTTIDVNGYSKSEAGDLLDYTDSNEFGCTAIYVDFGNDEMIVKEEKPCVIIPPDYGAQNDITTMYRTYSIEIEIYNQGGSEDDIFAAIEGLNGNLTDFVNIGKLANAGSSGKTFSINLNGTNVGFGAKVYLLNYGKDSLLIEGCTIDGNAYSETTYDILEYDGADPRGCHSVVCDVVGARMDKSERVPCFNYENPFNPNDTRTYRVVIDILTGGGSQDDTYIMIQGMSGRLSAPYNAGSMADGGQQYPFDITTLDIGDPKAIYLIKLRSDGSDVLIVDGCSVDSTYSVRETTGDRLEYTGTDLRGCGYVKCDFLKDEMRKGEEDVCNLIPVVVPIGNGTSAEYFVSIDTTNIPFSKPGGTEDDIWLRIINNANGKSEYVFLGNGMTDDGEVYTFRPNVKNLGSDIRYLKFIQFGKDDLCIDYCQINEQSVDLGIIGSTCNQNDVDDNDGCAIMTCDFQLNQITSTVESPCKQDVYGWNNKTYRVYQVVIDVCPDGGDLVDTKSVDPFWIYLENTENDEMTNGYRIGSIGSDDKNLFQLNTTNIGVPDKLYLVHYNNDDLCITGIEVDGFRVAPFLDLGFIWDEYDCEYPDEGCNVISVDFEKNEIDSETQAKCDFTPEDLNVEQDTCLVDKIDEWIDELFDFASLVGIISGVVLIVLILCCCGICGIVCWCVYMKSGNKSHVQSGDDFETYGRTSIEMR